MYISYMLSLSLSLSLYLSLTYVCLCACMHRRTEGWMDGRMDVRVRAKRDCFLSPHQYLTLSTCIWLPASIYMKSSILLYLSTYVVPIVYL